MRKFGTMTNNTCNFYLKDLLRKETQPLSSNIFYELFLQDLDGNYIDVPVLVRNLRVETPELDSDDKELPPNAGF